MLKSSKVVYVMSNKLCLKKCYVKFQKNSHVKLSPSQIYVNYNYNKKTSEYLNSKTTESNFRKDDDDDQNEFNSNYFRSNSFLSSATEENSYRDETEYKKKLMNISKLLKIHI